MAFENLSTRTRHCLWSANIRTDEELQRHYDSGTLKNISNFGPISFKEVECYLRPELKPFLALSDKTKDALLKDGICSLPKLIDVYNKDGSLGIAKIPNISKKGLKQIESIISNGKAIESIICEIETLLVKVKELAKGLQ